MAANLSGDSARQLADHYLSALARADASAILALFNPAGTVRSPLYGEQPATTFYPALLRDTARSEVALHDVLLHPERRSMAIYFHYRWQLADGTWNAFDCVDWIEVDEAGRILQLHIIYDTATTRPAFEAQRNTRP